MRVAVIEILAPMILTSLIGFANGALIGVTMMGIAEEVNFVGRLLAALLMLAAGWLAAAIAVAATQPLRSRLLAQVSRKND